MPKIFDITPGLIKPAPSEAELRDRFQAFLIELRKKKTPGAVKISDHDHWMLRRRAKKLHLKIDTPSGLPYVSREDRSLLYRVFDGVFLAGPQSEHDADEIAAELLVDQPWMQRPIDLIWKDMRRSASAGDGLKFRPIILDGPPSVGKTYLSKNLSRLTGVPEVFLDIGAGSDGFRLAGSTRTWGRSTPGRVVETILTKRIANPIVFIDEIDKAGVMRSSSGFTSSIVTSLLGMMEPTSAQGWECPYFAVKFDLTAVNWILASNEVGLVSQPLRSRCRLVRIEELSRAQIFQFAQAQVKKRGMDEEALEIVSRLLNVLPEDHHDLSLRGVLRVLDDLEALAEMPRLS